MTNAQSLMDRARSPLLPDGVIGVLIRPSSFGFSSFHSSGVLALGFGGFLLWSRHPRNIPRLLVTSISSPRWAFPFASCCMRAIARRPISADAAFQRIKQLNDIMSDYDADSELSRLSRTSGQGLDVALSDDLWLVLLRAQTLAERSGGAFDVTVGPCVNLWRKARRELKMPDPVRLEQARAAVGYKHVRLDPKRHTVRLLVPDMRLDLGGIAKGYAVDEALKVLSRLGINRALVAGGGDMAVGDPPPGRAGWRIELAPLDATNAPPARFVSLSHTAIATSGTSFNGWRSTASDIRISLTRAQASG